MTGITLGLRAQLRDWHERGIICSETFEKLQRDIDERRSSWSFSAVIILLGVICLGLGAISFVAANWEEIPRLIRLIILFSSLVVIKGITIAGAVIYDEPLL